MTDLPPIPEDVVERARHHADAYAITPRDAQGDILGRWERELHWLDAALKGLVADPAFQRHMTEVLLEAGVLKQVTDRWCTEHHHCIKWNNYGGEPCWHTQAYTIEVES